MDEVPRPLSEDLAADFPLFEMSPTWSRLQAQNTRSLS
jgi:hypothetical protein